MPEEAATSASAASEPTGNPADDIKDEDIKHVKRLSYYLRTGKTGHTPRATGRRKSSATEAVIEYLSDSLKGLVQPRRKGSSTATAGVPWFRPSSYDAGPRDLGSDRSLKSETNAHRRSATGVGSLFRRLWGHGDRMPPPTKV